MTNDPSFPPLMAGFETPSREAWVALVARSLKSADPLAKLTTTTADGIVIEPLYERRNDALAISGASAGRPWGITCRFDHHDIGTAATQALADLEGGADGLALVFNDSPSARGFGLAAGSAAAIDAALSDVMLDLIKVRLEPSALGALRAGMIAEVIANRRHDPAKVSINFGLDPIGIFATSGLTDAPWLDAARTLAGLVDQLRAAEFRGPFIACDTRVVSEAGGSPAQELAYALASGICYARALEDSGLSTELAFAAISWTVAIDADQAINIAKLRAVRRLWANVQSASNVTARPIEIHAETAWRMMSRRDASVNMLRATMASFAAATGGADTISVLPHTLAVGLPEPLARRIARNMQVILQEEAHLWRVADPAAGAGAIEALTDQLCAASWLLFQDIEREGGIMRALEQGLFQARIAVMRRKRNKDVATRLSPLTGVSEFPSITEPIVTVLQSAPTFVRTGERALPSCRDAEPFEALRDSADTDAAVNGKRCRVFLANLGPRPDHGPRSTWITNLLAAGGIDVIGTDGFTASGDVGAAFAQSGATLACLCGSDQTLDALADASAMALKVAGARHVLLAGKPDQKRAAVLTAAGVDQFISAGADILEALGAVHRALGIKRSSP